jgi:cytosine/uracil/thiamine/allantoin permease
MKPLFLSVVSSFGAFASSFAAKAGVISQIAGAIGACLGVVLTLLMVTYWLKKNIDRWRGQEDAD